ncbi:hypothetical protein Tco_1023330 [Tanacetum coccineum]
MSPPDTNNTYTKHPLENQILGFIKTLGYDEDPDTKMIVVSKMGIVHSANLDFASLIKDEFKWKTVDRYYRPSKMSKILSNSLLHSAQDDQPITKLSNTVKARKKESAKDKIIDEPEEKRMSLVKSRRGKGFMCYGDQAVNVPKKDVVPSKTRSLTIAEETVVRELSNSISIQEPLT